MGKCSNPVGKVRGERNFEKKKNAKVTNDIPKWIYFHKNWTTGFEISFVGTINISYTQSQQPRVAENHLTRLAKNGMVVVTYIATLPCGPLSFW